MSRTIKAIERHMILPVRLGPEIEETLSGHALRKLRLVFAPPYSVTTAGAAG